MCAVVRDADPLSAQAWAAAPVCILHLPESPRDRAGAEENSCWRPSDTGNHSWIRALDPDQEAALAGFWSRECSQALASKATSIATDEALLAQYAGSGPDVLQQGVAISTGSANASGLAAGSDTSSRPRQGSSPATARGTSGAQQSGQLKEAQGWTWLKDANRELALQWRLERKRLLNRIAEDLQVQSRLWGC